MINALRAHWARNKKIWITIVVLFIATRLVLYGISVLGTRYLQPQVYQNWKQYRLTEEPQFLKLWAVWDSQWYLNIAEYGYNDVRPFNPARHSTVGFFPLYSALISSLTLLTRDFLFSALLISNIFFLGAAFLMFKLVQKEMGEESAWRGLLYLFLFPTAYIFSAAYPESLLLFFWLAAAYAARKNRWLVAGGAGFCAAITKSNGVFIGVIFLIVLIQKIVELIRTRRERTGALSAIAPPLIALGLTVLGTTAVGMFHYILTGDFFANSHVQHGAWSHVWVNPLQGIWTHIFKYQFDYAFNGVVAVLFLVLLVMGIRRIKITYTIFAGVVILFTASNGIMVGMTRYLASLFPFILLFASWGKNRYVHEVLVSVLVILQGCLFLFWMNGYWFTS